LPKFGAAVAPNAAQEKHSMSWLFIIVVLVLVLAVVPAWPYSRDWGYAPSGLLGTVLLVLLVLVLLGKL
jgi:hypothetical protein